MRGSWISRCGRLNVHIAAGTFQHSSFLGGGIVTSAGLISVKGGVIHKLSPLSGHYRCVPYATWYLLTNVFSPSRTSIRVCDN